ncbi:MAG: hypothetical protein VXW60_02265 [Bacteroidota bacterium]|nr:hypothetical protein [Bacteroidota bacterium]
MSNKTRPKSEHPMKAQLENLEMYLKWSREAVEKTMYEPFTEVIPLDRCLRHIKEAEEAVYMTKQWHVIKKALGTYEEECDET